MLPTSALYFVRVQLQAVRKLFKQKKKKEKKKKLWRKETETLVNYWLKCEVVWFPQLRYSRSLKKLKIGSSHSTTRSIANRIQIMNSKDFCIIMLIIHYL